MERHLFRSGVTSLGSVDEVGRGSPAGPVFVGLVVIDVDAGRPPAGVRDSKLLTHGARLRLVPLIESWAVATAIGQATPCEIDTLGLTAALRLAGVRALGQLAEPPDLVLLDGNHDWLSDREPDRPDALGGRPAVHTRIKADLTCTSVAAASILAKVARDAVMVELAAEYPGYGWETNKGYATGAHLAAIRRLGKTPHHRHSWRLPEPFQPGEVAPVVA